jgi:hypothetical protein
MVFQNQCVKLDVLLSSCSVRYEHNTSQFHYQLSSFKLGVGRCLGSECYGCMVKTSDIRHTHVGTASSFKNMENRTAGICAEI